MKNNKSMIEKEISMGKFLSLFLEIEIEQARNITHKDVRKLFPYLKIVSDYDFHNKYAYKNVDPKDFVRVKDKTNLVMYYYKRDLEQNLVVKESTDNIDEANIICNFMASDISDIDKLFEYFNRIDLSSMSKIELCMLECRLKKLKKIVGYKRDIISHNVNKIQKQLRKIKKEESK